jgi:hypothetical protein
MKKIFVLLFSLMVFLSCRKEPGIGGNGMIQGHVQTRHFNASFTQLLGTYPAADHYVYIVFGDHQGFDKRIKTDYNGDYQFEYLYPGNYSVYTYSLDSSGTVLSGQIVLKQEVNLAKKEVKDLENFVIYE